MIFSDPQALIHETNVSGDFTAGNTFDEKIYRLTSTPLNNGKVSLTIFKNGLNNLVNNYDYYSKSFIIYGENSNDNTVEDKCNQINKLGFNNIYAYKGGLFEWLLLQDIYGKEEFKTTSNILDILKYKAKKIL